MRDSKDFIEKRSKPETRNGLRNPMKARQVKLGDCSSGSRDAEEEGEEREEDDEDVEE